MTSRASTPRAHALLDVVALAALSGVLVALWLILGHHAWTYYTTPLAIRGYDPAHRFLRPSGTGGHLIGVAGTFLLFCTLAYLARRRVKRLAKAGSVTTWLEVHIFCGVFGPILITYHTSLKFNGIVSVAYWSMFLVVLSGFVGRYLYVRIPKSIRGEELSRAELEQKAAELKARLADTTLPMALVARIEEEEKLLLARATTERSLPARIHGAWEARRRGSLLRRRIRSSGLNRQLLHDVLALANERSVLLLRIARLEKTRRMFALWHVFHRPLVWVMFFIFFVHLGVAIYFGYTSFGG